MNWDDVAVFLAVARTGRARAAAEQLGISQPTIGRRIERLERDLRSPLFDRSREGYVLTKQGVELVSMAEAMDTAAQGLQHRSLPRDALSPIDVRISALEWPATLLATNADKLHALEELASARLEIDVSDETAALSMRQADIAIRHEIPPSGDFITRKLGTIACAVYGAAAYVAGHPAARSERRYGACDWIMYTHEQAHYPIMLWLSGQLGDRQPRFRGSTTAVIHEAVAAGGGLAILPCLLADRDPRCVRVGAVMDDLHSGDYWLIVHKQLLRRPAFRRTVDGLVRIFADATRPARIRGESKAARSAET